MNKWTQQEKVKLINLVQTHGSNWKTVCSFLPGRSARSCRIKYLDELDPSVKKGAWSEEEDCELYSLIFRDLESKISLSQATFNGRSKKDILNRAKAFKIAISKIIFGGKDIDAKCQNRNLYSQKSNSQTRTEKKRDIKLESKVKSQNYDGQYRGNNNYTFCDFDSVKKENSANNQILQDSCLNSDSELASNLNSRKVFFKSSRIYNSSEEYWSISDDQLLFKYYDLFGPDWLSISEMIPNKNVNDVKDHFINTLKWVAAEYKKDIDSCINLLYNKFQDKDIYYIKYPTQASEVSLLCLVPIAKHLLKINPNSQKSNPALKLTMKREPLNQVENVGRLVPISLSNTNKLRKCKIEESKSCVSTVPSNFILIEDEADEVSKSIRSLAARISWRESNCEEENKTSNDEGLLQTQ